MTNLVVDLNNLTKVTRWGLKSPKSHRQKQPLVAQKIFKDVLTSIIFHAQRFSCKGIMVAADSRKNWRKDIYPQYKGKDKTEDVYLEETYEALNMLEDFFRMHTSCYMLKFPKTEGDDIIGVWCQETDEDVIILSTDTDYAQLTSDRVRLYSPVQKTFREYDDPEYELFVKCIRGDDSDNIRKAYKGLRETAIKKAWEDPLAMMNLLNDKTPDGRDFIEALEFNMKLIDLRQQPQHLRDGIYKMIKEYEPSKFDEIEGLVFLGKIGIPKSGDIFTPAANKILNQRPKF